MIIPDFAKIAMTILKTLLSLPKILQLTRIYNHSMIFYTYGTAD